MNNLRRRATALALVIAVGVTSVGAAPTMGPNGNYYEIITYPAAGVPSKQWEDANTAARNRVFMGIVGHLATITDAAEDTYINNIRGTLGEVWVGGRQPPANATGVGWVWINGDGAISTPQVVLPGVYMNWLTGEPNDNTGAGSENFMGVGLGNQFGWNDEGALGNIKGFVVEYDTGIAETFVDPGEDQLIFAAANEPNSENPLTAGYQEVLEGGTVTIDCCRVLDTRETAGHHYGYGYKFKPKKFDIGKAVADIYTNPSCVDMPTIDPYTAFLQPWQRGIPESRGLDSDGSAREHDIGVCLIQADVLSKGVVFSAEETKNVLGYSVDCSETDVSYRPFTAGVAIDPREVDSPYVTRWTADCDGSRSAKKFSDNVMVLNVRHDTHKKPTKPYLFGLAKSLKKSINITRQQGCVDNSEGFLNNLNSLLKDARKKIARRKGEDAVVLLDDATRLALLLDSSPLLPMNEDPYGMCPGNPKGLIAGRFMSLKFAVCSELAQSGPGENAKSPAFCEIAPDILADMPALPGF